MAVTNLEIIETAKQQLFAEGILKATGRYFTAKVNGEEVTLPEIEEIHTFQAWKALGYQVQKGEKAIAAFEIWKYAAKKKAGKSAKLAENEEEEKGYCFLKLSHFFKGSQVKKI